MLRPADPLNPPPPPSVSLLILGAGWTSTYLLPLLSSLKITHAATSTTGRPGTIPFKFDPDSSDQAPFTQLPTATTILITFPLKGANQSSLLTTLYKSTHPHSSAQFIQLGSTGIFTDPHWNDRHSSYDTSNARAIAETELLAAPINGCVLNLAGLYGQGGDAKARDPRNWVDRVVKSKEDLRGKKALHLVNGRDVARAVVAVHGNWEKTKGERWLVNDLRCYDWWDLILSWGAERLARLDEEEVVVMADKETEREREKQLELMRWVGECMEEEGMRALPRGPETLGRVLDSREFWREMGISPSVGRVR